MAMFPSRAQSHQAPSAADLARVVPASDEAIREEAMLTAGASDATLRRRFADVWPRTFEVPADREKRVDAVRDAMLSKEREEVAELGRRADGIGRLSDEERMRVFGVRTLPSEPAARAEATIDLAMRDVQGYESPRVAAERALEKARGIRDALSVDRTDADRFKDISPLARVLWKHVPDMAARAGATIAPGEGYLPSDPEHRDAGLAIHNSGADARAASKVRGGFSQAVNRDLDMLVGPNGADGMVDRMVKETAERERRMLRPAEPVRNPARDMSAAAYLSGIFSR